MAREHALERAVLEGQLERVALDIRRVRSLLARRPRASRRSGRGRRPRRARKRVTKPVPQATSSVRLRRERGDRREGLGRAPPCQAGFVRGCVQPALQPPVVVLVGSRVVVGLHRGLGYASVLPLESVPNFSEGRDRDDDRRDRRGARRSGRGCSTSTPTRTTTARSSRSSAKTPRSWRRSSPESQCARGADRPAPARGGASRGSVPRTSCRSSRSRPGTWSARRPRRRRRPGGSASSACRCSCTAAPGRGPAFFRRGGPEGLQQRIDAGELVPDFGPSRLDPAAGAVLVGARRPLIAFNVNLASDDVEVARAIAAVVRESGGGFPGRAGARPRPAARRARPGQHERRGLGGGRAARDRRAGRRGGARPRESSVIGSELVGLMPAGAAAAAAGAMLRIDGFDASRVLELRLLDES